MERSSRQGQADYHTRAGLQCDTHNRQIRGASQNSSPGCNGKIDSTSSNADSDCDSVSRTTRAARVCYSNAESDAVTPTPTQQFFMQNTVVVSTPTPTPTQQSFPQAWFPTVQTPTPTPTQQNFTQTMIAPTPALSGTTTQPLDVVSFTSKSGNFNSV